MNDYGKYFAPPYALDLTKRERVETWYRNARWFIMASVVLTCLCTFLSFLSPHLFLLTLTIPHSLMVWGYLSSGYVSADVVKAYTESGFDLPAKDDSAFIFAAVAAIFVLFLYIVCWYRSNNYHVGWLVAALALTLADTAAMVVLQGFPPFGIVFHAGIITLQIIGIRAHFRLKKMPPDHPNLIPLDDLK